MIALDTNILVRYLVRDDPDEAVRAEMVLLGEQVFIADTVLLETEWVLRQVYGVGKPAATETIADLIGLPNVSVSDRSQITQALEWSRGKLDFADALHLSQSMNVEAFLTFDKTFASRAKRLNCPIPVSAPAAAH